MSDRSKGWLRSFQVRTFPLTLIASMVGFLLAGGIFFTPLALGLALWVWVSHSFLFGYDALLSKLGGEHGTGGGPSFETLYKLVTLELLPWFAGSVLLSYFGPGDIWQPLASALVFLASAYVYHVTSRFTAWSFVPSSISIASLAVFSYFAAGGGMDPLFVTIMVSVFLAALFWRSWSKEIEALGVGGLNLPERIGVEVDRGILRIPRLGRVYADGLKAAFLVVSGYAMLGHALEKAMGATGAASSVSSSALFGGIGWAVLVGLAVGFGDLVATSQPWSEEKLVAWVGVEELLTFLSLLVIPAMLSGWAPLLLLGAFSFAWLAAADWLIYDISPVELPLREALATFRDRIRGLAPSERTGRDVAQEIADRIAEDRGVPRPLVKVEDFGVSVTGRRGKFQPPNEIAVDGLFLGFVVLSEEETWRTLLAGTIAREFQKYLSFLGGAKAPVTAGMEEAELEETGWSGEELEEVEEELASSLERVERRGSTIELRG